MGHKSSKNNVTADLSLSRKTIDELCKNTGFTEEELMSWHSNFYKDCPDGKLTLRQFEQEYAKIMGKPTQKTADYVKHMFNVYDQDKNQFIDFKEFVMALSAASAVNRLRLIETLFRVFDLDNDGKITKEEIGKMLHTLVDVTNSNNKHHHSNQHEKSKQTNLQQRIDDAFNSMNANDDDHITKDEFIQWYMDSGLLSNVQSDEINVPDASQIQKIEKKSRKLMKQSSYTKSNTDSEENRNRNLHIVRHMSRMRERKTLSQQHHEDEDDAFNISITNDSINSSQIDSYNEGTNIDDEGMPNRSVIHLKSSSDDTDSHNSKENERWQHLFNSVLGQIRAQRLREQQLNVNESSNFSSWKREGEERLKVEYRKQNINGRHDPLRIPTENIEIRSSRTTSDERPPSPDIVTVRL